MKFLTKTFLLTTFIFLFTAIPTYTRDSSGTCTCDERGEAKFVEVIIGSMSRQMPAGYDWKNLTKPEIFPDVESSNCLNGIYDVGDSVRYRGCKFELINPTVTSIADEFKISEPILGLTWPGLDFTKAEDTLWVDSDGRLYTLAPWLAEFIATVYKFALGIVSIIAVVMIIIEGIQMILSGTTIAVEGFDSSTGEKQAAVSRLKNIARIMIGLFIAWTSYMILFQINPNLINLKVLKTIYIQKEAVSVAMLTDDSIIESSDNYDENSGRKTENDTVVPYFSQRDSAWRSCDPNPKPKIPSSGCGITSIAMVLKYLGVNTNPCDVYKKNKGVGLVMSTLIPQFKVNGDMLAYRVFPTNEQTIGKVKKCLDNNIPVLIYTTQKPFTGRYHFMVLTSYSGSTFNINDPNKNLTTMPATKVFSPNPPSRCQDIFEKEGREPKCANADRIFPNFRIIYNTKTHDSDCNPVALTE